MNQSLATVSTAVQMYGTNEDVGLITDRLMSMHPQAAKVGRDGMRAVAQLALMMGANPLPTAGEIYVWVDWKGNTSTDLGIAYYRRKASEKDTVIWQAHHEPRPMTEQEREYYHVPAGALTGICRGFLLSEYTQLLDRGVPWQAAQELLARTSHAIVAQDEMFFADTEANRKYNRVGKSSPPPTGRTWQWVAEKRAEKGFYRMKSLVDTTLTDAIQVKAKQVLAKLGAQIDRVPMSDEEDAKWQAALFDTSEPEAIQGEYEEVEDEQDEDEFENSSNPFGKGDKVKSKRTGKVGTVTAVNREDVEIVGDDNVTHVLSYDKLELVERLATQPALLAQDTTYQE